MTADECGVGTACVGRCTCATDGACGAALVCRAVANGRAACEQCVGAHCAALLCEDDASCPSPLACDLVRHECDVRSDARRCLGDDTCPDDSACGVDDVCHRGAPRHAPTRAPLVDAAVDVRGAD